MELIDTATFNLLQEDCLVLGGKIAKFMSYLRDSELKGTKFKKNESNKEQ